MYPFFFKSEIAFSPSFTFRLIIPVSPTIPADTASIFIFEFKVDSKEEEAIKQIKEKKYYEKYLSDGKDIYMVGINFDPAEENITNYQWEKYND